MRELLDSERETLLRLYGNVVNYQQRNTVLTNFATGNQRIDRLGFSIPPSMREFGVVLSWPQQSCDAVSERIDRKWFTARTKTGELFTTIDELASEPRYKLAERQAIDAALRHGVSFVFTSRGNTSIGEPDPILVVRSALAASAERDPRSGRVTAALELLGGSRVNLYLPGLVLECVRNPGTWRVAEEYPTGTNRVLCTPFVHDPTSEKPLGHSRITPTLQGLTMAAARTSLRHETAEEFTAAPRIITLGGGRELFENEHGDIESPWKALTGAVWGVPDEVDEVTGERSRVEIAQLQQLNAQPYNERIRRLAEQVSGETGIPASQLGVTQDSNPASEAAIVASENRLVRIAQKQFSPFGMSMTSLAMDQLTALFGDLGEAGATDLRGLAPRFADPRTRSVIEQSQFVAQQVGSGNFQAGTLETLQELPIDPEAAVAHAEANRRLFATNSIMARMGEAQVNPEHEAAETRRIAYQALKEGIYAGGTFESVKADLALAGIDVSGIEWSGTFPNTLRLPENEAAGLEDA